MRSITQLAENDGLGDQFVTEIIGVFLGDLSKRVDAIGLLIARATALESLHAHTPSKAVAVILAPLA